MDAALERKLLGLLGLSVRGRLALVGVDRVREAVKKDEVRVAIVAADASENSRDKILPLLVAREVPTIEVPSAAALGQAVGKDTTAVVGVTEAQMAKGILAAAGAEAMLKGSRRQN
jgi:ribosomal protein L7Ae-like RNA K-turn-binding protein